MAHRGRATEAKRAWKGRRRHSSPSETTGRWKQLLRLTEHLPQLRPYTGRVTRSRGGSGMTEDGPGGG